MRIALGNDHAGASMRTVVLQELQNAGHQVVDFGCTVTTESVDYPDFARKVALAVTAGQADRGVLICGTGIGMSITANKFRGIRCALCTDTYAVRMTRRHNDANVLALRSREIDPETVREIVRIFLSEAYEGGRHQNRLDKIAAIEAERAKETCPPPKPSSSNTPA